jgi:hypothetical protein
MTENLFQWTYVIFSSFLHPSFHIALNVIIGNYLGKPEAKSPLGGPKRRWVDNIKIDLKRDRMGWYGLD